ncbi:52 kDa repressor of the inhibitor of the protein kinase-like [Ptychodera flava]|uniref:52 kDa repressor of the inhibitor of the protein kinase-like n=1 Tax=Ptychodera flava TaxID=63121 RepID=UPI00396A9C45
MRLPVRVWSTEIPSQTDHQPDSMTPSTSTQTVQSKDFSSMDADDPVETCKNEWPDDVVDSSNPYTDPANYKQHLADEDHKFAFLSAKFKPSETKNTGSDIRAKINKAEQNKQFRIKKGILSIIDVVIALGQRGIPYRGNWVKEDQAEDGNFAFFIDWKSKFDPDLADHLRHASGIAKYTSPQIQNEIMLLCESHIRERIVSSITQYWSVMADETQDCSTSEQISLCVRYVKGYEVCEDFLGFVQIRQMDASTISATIIESLTRWGLNLDNLVGQGYDGAAVMSSNKNGVQAIIQKRFPNATYVHCRSHVLALVLAAGCKQVPEIRNLFDNVEKLTWFLSGSAKRRAIFENVNTKGVDSDLDELLHDDNDEDEFKRSSTEIKHGSQRKYLPKLCPTRWSARVDTLSFDCKIQELETRFDEQHSNLVSAQALIPCNIDQLTSTTVKSIREYYGKFLSRGDTLALDTEIDRWITLHRKTQIESRQQNVSEALVACDPEYFPVINKILVIS